MSQPSTVRLERTTPRTARITFANPPANLVIPESVVALHKIVAELENDPDIQVVVFSSELPDFFINHYDGAAAADLPVPEHEDDNPVWTDMVLRLSKAPFVSIAVIRGCTRGAATSWPWPATCATPAARRPSSASPRSASASSPAEAAPSDSRAPSAATAHWRRS
jgi:enoyl-CoA hydratase/carnithine racemase